MHIRWIASTVVAALLMTGGAVTAGRVTERTLTQQEATAIALEHAALTESEITGLRVEYELDDGIGEWEVEFYAHGMEYDYEIHAETGMIRSWDQERAD